MRLCGPSAAARSGRRAVDTSHAATASCRLRSHCQHSAPGWLPVKLSVAGCQVIDCTEGAWLLPVYLYLAHAPPVSLDRSSSPIQDAFPGADRRRVARGVATCTTPRECARTLPARLAGAVLVPAPGTIPRTRRQPPPHTAICAAWSAACLGSVLRRGGRRCVPRISSPSSSTHLTRSSEACVDCAPGVTQHTPRTCRSRGERPGRVAPLLTAEESQGSVPHAAAEHGGVSDGRTRGQWVGQLATAGGARTAPRGRSRRWPARPWRPGAGDARQDCPRLPSPTPPAWQGRSGAARQ